MDHTPNIQQNEGKKRYSGTQVLGIIALVMILTAGLTLVGAWFLLHPRPFTPVVLSQKEQHQLQAKLDRMEAATGVAAPPVGRQRGTAEEYTASGRLRPEAYSEEGASREVSFSEREVNALIATNTDLADKVAVDLSRDLVSLKMLVPLEPDFPFIGGKVLRVRAGMEIAYREGRPVVKLKGISLMGVPLPNAWLGGMKNVDLVREFSGEQGFWKAFADGVASISVAEGTLAIVMKE